MQLEQPKTNLKREITLYGLIMIAAGSAIGSGIFLTPRDIATDLPIPHFIIIAWIFGGLVAIAGSLTFAELSARFPETGGVYVYLKEAFGKLAAFLYGWVHLTVITTGAIAALGIGFAQYFNDLVGLNSEWNVAIGIIAISILTVINIFGVKIGQLVASSFTTMKLIGIAVIILIGLFYIPDAFTTIDPWDSRAIDTTDVDLVKGFSLALIGVLWSYSGWYHASFLAGETKNAHKTLPKAMIIGTIVIMVTYVLSNIAYHSLLTIPEIQNSSTVAADAVAKFHSAGGIFVSLLIAISIFGTTSIFTMSAPRIYFAMAKDDVFFKNLAKINPVYKTPVNAIIIQSLIAMILLVSWQTFKNLTIYVIFMDWAFLALAAIGLFIIRQKNADRGIKDPDDSYKAWGYPFVPLFFIIVSIVFILTTFYYEPNQTIGGLIVLASGVLVYNYFNRRNE